MNIDMGNPASTVGVSATNAAGGVSVELVDAFLRQLSHDVRNDLNAMDLLISYAEDLGAGEKAASALEQLHGAVRYGSQRMVRISKAFQIPTPDRIPYPVDLLFEDLRDRLSVERPELSHRLRWVFSGDPCLALLDPVLVLEAMTELLQNAAAFSASEEPVHVAAQGDGDGAFWRIEQSAPLPLKGMPQWGMRPLESSRRAHYGLGLYRVRRILQSLGAKLNFSHDLERGVLLSEVFFPGTAG
jgi:signal transduction histidine kinase